MIYIIFYVDDMLILGQDKPSAPKFSNMVAQKFEVRREYTVTMFLGILVERNMEKGTIKIHNSAMINSWISKFRMEDAKVISTPLPDGTDVFKSQNSNMNMTEVPYRELSGSLLYLANTVRPDISFTMGLLFRFLESTEPQHWNAAKHVLRYLKKTRTMGITYSKSSKKQAIFGYRDSDFAGDKTDRNSTSGYDFILSGGAITWSSKKKCIFANSSQEGEYVALNIAIREAV